MGRSKFNVDKDCEKRTCDGLIFDSVLEMKYYRDVLCPKVESGDVVYFELQKPYELQPEFVHDDRRVRAVTYVADFFIRYADGREEVIDTKGCPDTSAILKRKLFWYKYPDTTYIWVGYSRIDGGWVPYETIKKGRSERRKLKKQKMLEELKEETNGKED